MKSQVYPTVSALLASIASAVFLVIAKDTYHLPVFLTLVLYFILTLVLWAPSNYFYALSMRHGTPSVIFTLFGVCTTVFDILISVVLFSQFPTKPLYLVAGFILGMAVILFYGPDNDESSDLRDNNHYLEYGLYLLTVILIFTGFLTRSATLQILAYCTAEFSGAVLVVKISEKLKSHSQFFRDWFSGLIGFAPALFAGLILLANVKILAVAGPVTAIAGAATAIPGTLIFFKNEIKLSKSIIFLFVSALAIWFIFSSY